MVTQVHYADYEESVATRDLHHQCDCARLAQPHRDGRALRLAAVEVQSEEVR